MPLVLDTDVLIDYLRDRAEAVRVCETNPGQGVGELAQDTGP